MISNHSHGVLLQESCKKLEISFSWHEIQAEMIFSYDPSASNSYGRTSPPLVSGHGSKRSISTRAVMPPVMPTLTITADTSIPTYTFASSTTSGLSMPSMISRMAKELKAFNAFSS